MDTAEVLPTDEDLRAWDWLKTLKEQDRSVIWLARKTDTVYHRVYRYGYGQTTPIEWLRKAAAVLDFRPE